MFHFDTYAYQDEEPEPHPLTDGYGTPISIGDDVLFYLNGHIAFGKLTAVDKFHWKKSKYHEQIKKAGQFSTWLFECRIKVELTREIPRFQAGHISTLKTIYPLLKLC